MSLPPRVGTSLTRAVFKKAARVPPMHNCTYIRTLIVFRSYRLSEYESFRESRSSCAQEFGDGKSALSGSAHAALAIRVTGSCAIHWGLARPKKPLSQALRPQIGPVAVDNGNPNFTFSDSRLGAF